MGTSLLRSRRISEGAREVLEALDRDGLGNFGCISCLLPSINKMNKNLHVEH